MGRIGSFLMSLALAAAAAGLAYAAVENRERAGAQAGLQNQPSQARHLGSLPTPNDCEANGCSFNVARESPCVCAGADPELDEWHRGEP